MIKTPIRDQGIFDRRSLANVSKMLPPLRAVLFAARKEYPFLVPDGLRGKIAQEKAFHMGRSKVHFGESPHNYLPCLAGDCYPAPFNPDDPISKFVHMQMDIIKHVAQRLGVPLRFGIDFNMDGNLSNDKWDDAPHVELHPWRDWAKQSKLYRGI